MTTLAEHAANYATVLWHSWPILAVAAALFVVAAMLCAGERVDEERAR